MRRTRPGTGHSNLRDAVAVAADPDARDRGVLVTMAGLVLAARDARKTHSRAIDAFQAPDAGAIGRVVGGRVELGERTGRPPHLPVIPADAAEPILIITAVVATDGDLLRAAVERGARGIVVAATGSGNTDPDLLAAARRPWPPACRSCSSAVAGRAASLRPTGSRAAVRPGTAGVIMGGTASGPSARVALALGLGAGLDDGALRRLIAG